MAGPLRFQADMAPQSVINLENGQQLLGIAQSTGWFISIEAGLIFVVFTGRYIDQRDMGELREN
jgi:hypothetical protein